jgi:hypothetical protein
MGSKELFLGNFLCKNLNIFYNFEVKYCRSLLWYEDHTIVSPPSPPIGARHIGSYFSMNMICAVNFGCFCRVLSARIDLMNRWFYLRRMNP